MLECSENVVIIQHEGGIHTVYSHLDDIAPTLVVGKWVQKRLSCRKSR